MKKEVEQRTRAHTQFGCCFKTELAIFLQSPQRGVYIYKEEDSGHTLVPYTSTPYSYCCQFGTIIATITIFYTLLLFCNLTTTARLQVCICYCTLLHISRPFYQINTKIQKLANYSNKYEVTYHGI